MSSRTVLLLLSLSLFVNFRITFSNAIQIEKQSANSKLNINNSKSFDNVGILTTKEFELFNASLQFIKEAKCRYDLNATLWGLVNAESWAVAMYDASVKSAVGIESGVLHQFGHFQQCLEQHKYNNNNNDLTDIPVRAKYCLADVTVNGLTVHNIDTRMPKNVTTVHWGVCVPASCSAHDVAKHLQYMLQLQPEQVHVAESMCQLENKQLIISNSMFAYAIIICFFVLLAVLSTCYHIYLLLNADKHGAASCKSDKIRQETKVIALLSFSIIENVQKLFQGSKDQLGLNSINGIKALAMILILAGHALSFVYGGPAYNTNFINMQTYRPTFAFLTNSLLFVDTFLLLSGFLFCRILLIELERRRGKINVAVLYIGRYIRLTPAYMATIGFYMTWFPTIGSGPIWPQRIAREQARCQASWWLNILYINNYINTDKLCMFQSWYLSVDSQLFFVAPIAIYLLYRTRKHGLRFLIALAIFTASIPFVVTFLRKLDPTLLIYSDEMTDLNTNAYYVNSYIKTHMRASAYVVGLLVGYLVHIMQEKGTKLPSTLVRLTWLSAIVVGATSMFAVVRFYEPFTNLESTLYAGFHKIGWNLSIGWLVLAATTGHAGWLQTLLSKRIFAPISRLTYCAYLSNGIVELYHSSNLQTLPQFGYVELFNKTFGHVLDTFIVAMLLCLLFESPIHALERILLRNANQRDKHNNVERKSDSNSPSTSEEQVA